MSNKTQDMLKKLAEMPERKLTKALKGVEQKRDSKDKAEGRKEGKENG